MVCDLVSNLVSLLQMSMNNVRMPMGGGMPGMGMGQHPMGPGPGQQIPRGLSPGHSSPHQQHPGPGYPPVITPAPLPMSASLSQLPANLNLVQQIQLPASNSLQPGGVVPHPPHPPPLHHLHHVQKKPGEGWGGRGAKLPKVPVPLPSLPPNKAYAGSHSFEEVEEDLK